MIPWIVYGLVLGISLVTNAFLVAIWFTIKRAFVKDPQTSLRSLLEGVGMKLRNVAIVFDGEGHFQIMPTTNDCRDHIPEKRSA